nr:AMP-binding protein [Thiocapsa sp. KS1]
MNAIITANPQSASHRVAELAYRYHGLKLPIEDDPELGQLLSRIPVTTKADLVACGSEREEEYLRGAVLFSETSGSTGIPLQTPRGAKDLQWNVLNQIAAYKRHLEPGVDRIAVIHPSVLSPFVEASCHALTLMGVGYVRLFPIPGICSYERIHSVLARYRITAIMTTPTLAYKVLYETRDLRASGDRLPLRKVLLTGELISLECAANMETILGPGSRVTPFVYGSSETATLMIGTHEGRYLPIREDFVFEVEPEDGAGASAEGEITGRLLVTWLRDGMLPILRYDTGDRFTWVRTDDSGYFRFEGRVDGGGIDPARAQIIDQAVFSLPLSVYHYQYETERKRLSIVTGGCKCDERLIERALLDGGGLAADTRIVLDPEESDFYGFSPLPKLWRIS